MPASVDFRIRRRDAFAALERAVERVEGLLDATLNADGLAVCHTAACRTVSEGVAA